MMTAIKLFEVVCSKETWLWLRERLRLYRLWHRLYWDLHTGLWMDYGPACHSFGPVKRKKRYENMYKLLT
ncbi:hypothetical protein DPMN_027144 [Dreissena polymorpha]|uniref:Uncharacterized protein n=1 Tax=Dreissena polymorpha TaxID=45954 RepID=A0A9D4LTU0_DREPO|nr:hypothetical protein DPMN_027144 [Dreissena polymorpha]